MVIVFNLLILKYEIDIYVMYVFDIYKIKNNLQSNIKRIMIY